MLALGGLGLMLALGLASPAGAQTPPLGANPSVATPQVPESTDSAATPAAPEQPASVATPAQEEPGQQDEPVEAEAPGEETEGDRTHANEECLHILEDDPEATGTDCEEAPNPLLPETNEIIWGALGFVIVFFFLAKFGLPQIKSTMNARTERIRSDLQAAEDQRNEAETVLAEYRAQLNDARAEAGRIIEEARQAADQIRRDQEANLQTELAELRQRAVADIDAAKAQAMSDLRSDVAQLAIGAAETIVGRSLDASTQNQLVEDYINEIATRRS
jgi:F-type H+-transporting ATPase subunit b